MPSKEFYQALSNMIHAYRPNDNLVDITYLGDDKFTFRFKSGTEFDLTLDEIEDMTRRWKIE